MHPWFDKVLIPLDRALTRRSVWSFVERTIIRFARGLRNRRTRVFLERLQGELLRLLTVRGGIFAGMRYGSLDATCSAILPKLLGTYEAELAEVFTRMLERSYEIIYDVGCAEGYYAVGLALRFPRCKVVAFDVDPRARGLCEENALTNGVASRLEIRGAVSADELASLSLDRRCLIICDCEGYEGELFNARSLHAYRNCDLVVETHDFIEPRVSEKIENLFSLTHHVSKIHSIDDAQKARQYRHPLIDHLDMHARETALAESRPVIMQWLVLSSKILAQPAVSEGNSTALCFD